MCNSLSDLQTAFSQGSKTDKLLQGIIDSVENVHICKLQAQATCTQMTLLRVDYYVFVLQSPVKIETACLGYNFLLSQLHQVVFIDSSAKAVGVLDPGCGLSIKHAWKMFLLSCFQRLPAD